MITIGSPSALRSSSSSRRTWLRLLASSALTGSSQISSRGLGGQRAGDGHPLPLAARDLARACGRARVASRPTCSSAADDPVADLGAGPSPRIRSPSPTIPRRSGPGPASAAGPGRRAAGARGGAAARRAPRRRAEMAVPPKHDPAAHRVDQPGHRAGQRGLARAGLADQADDLAGPDRRSTPLRICAGPPAAAEHHVDRLAPRAAASATAASGRRGHSRHQLAGQFRRVARGSGPRGWSPTGDRSAPRSDRHGAAAPTGQRSAKRQPAMSAPTCGG